jgi:hypothetical protein
VTSAVASIAARAGWSDAEVVALIRERRERAGDDLQKAARPDYLARTVAKAREGIVPAPALEGESADAERERRVEELADAIKSPLATEPFTLRGRSWEVVLADGHRVVFPDSASLRNPRRAEDRFLEDARLVVSLGTRESWARHVATIAAYAAAVAVATEADETRFWIRDVLDRGWLPANGDYLGNTEDKALRSYRVHAYSGIVPAWREGGEVLVSAGALVNSLRTRAGLKSVSLRDVEERLSRFGLTKRRRGMRDGEKLLRVRAWVGPWALVEEPDDPGETP